MIREKLSAPNRCCRKFRQFSKKCLVKRGLKGRQLNLKTDDVTFNQYSTFKLFLEIIYELREVNSLSVDEATAVYFYAHKYEVIDTTDKIQTHLNKRLKDGLSKRPLSVAELNDGLQFADTYQLEDFKKELDKVKLDFDEENPVQFFDLAVSFQMILLKDQIIQHLKTIEPNDTWTLEISHLVLKCLQKEHRKQTRYRCMDCRSKHLPTYEGTNSEAKASLSLRN